MNEHQPTSILEVQVEALLQQTSRDKEQRCNELRASADSQVREILRSARAEALARVRKAVAEERSRIEQGLRQAEARAELEARRREQQETETLLQRMWAEIGEALEMRWRDPVQRRAWMEAATAQAGVLLRGRAWRIEHGAGWPQNEQRELEELARTKGSGKVERMRDATLGAGLKVRAEGVCLDATVPGLLVRREEIEAAFLAEYLGGLEQARP